MKKSLAALSPGERAIATSGAKNPYTAYGYMETELYAELRELPFRTPGSRGDDPNADVRRQLKSIKEAFAPKVAEAIVRGFRRRIQMDNLIVEESRLLYDTAVKEVFGIEF